MFKFYKEPKSKDKNYIEDVFTMLYNLYGKINYTQSKIETIYQIQGFREIKNIIISILFELRIDGVIIREGDIGQEDIQETFRIPSTYDFLEEQGKLTIFITGFGVENSYVTISEMILFLSSYKFSKDGYAVPDEIFDDVEQSYRPFLVCLSIFYGYGIQLLERNWISGGYYCEQEMKLKRYKYYVPLELNTIIYAFTFCLFYQKKSVNFDDFQQPILQLNNDIQKEIRVCEKYFERNKSDFMNWLLKMEGEYR